MDLEISVSCSKLVNWLMNDTFTLARSFTSIMVRSNGHQAEMAVRNSSQWSTIIEKCGLAGPVKGLTFILYFFSFSPLVDQRARKITVPKLSSRALSLWPLQRYRNRK